MNTAPISTLEQAGKGGEPALGRLDAPRLKRVQAKKVVEQDKGVGLILEQLRKLHVHVGLQAHEGLARPLKRSSMSQPKEWAREGIHIHKHHTRKPIEKAVRHHPAGAAAQKKQALVRLRLAAEPGLDIGL